ncbi:hypothetical protein LMG26858_00853 [Achromobacter anxifer]|uniref:Uncharacterized protein n=1 Tax=Achromobacter anxifer TaxID=1287737 RepID=A0A6S7C828_9BURK|nr:baseplate J/gp47 family protein [Achromobacter anxifer]CAB3834242.1 hypothetical protein LMG26858_00853 [Achromobacter anxifer]
MPYPIPAFEGIRSALLRDLQNLRPDVAITEDSDWFIRASSIASCVEGLYAHQTWIVRQIFPDTADSEYLEMHAAIRGLQRKAAVAASGTVRITGVPGAQLAAGARCKALDGREYVLDASVVIGADGTAIASMRAVVAGEAGNAPAGVLLTLTVTPAQINGQAVVVSMKGGVEGETDHELLQRLLDLIRRPPAGGNAFDYKRWALEVPGVTKAFVYPLRRGLGTVDIAIVAGDGLPSEETLEAVRTYIDGKRPVTAKGVYVFAPTQRMVNVQVLRKVADDAVTVVDAQIRSRLVDQFHALNPGESWIKSRAEALVTNISNVEDRAIPWPVSNVVPVVNENTVEWLRLGVLTIGALA